MRTLYILLPADSEAAVHRNRPKTVLEIFYYISIATSVIPFGSVYPVLSAVNSGCFACIALICGITQVRNASEALRRFVFWLCLLSGLIVVWALAQTIVWPTNPLANSAWGVARRYLQDDGGAISVNPAATREGLLTLLAPILSAYIALTLFSSDQASLRLWRFLSYFSAGLVLVTVLQHFMFPQTLLFYPKWAYQYDFSVTFVNRNTAATFIGTALLLNIGLFVFQMQGMHWAEMWKAMIASQMKLRRHELWIVVHGSACFILALSLVLTRSRAGFISTVIGVLVFVIVYTYGNKPQWLANRPKLFATTFLAIVAGTISMFLLFGGITIERISEQGIEDSARWCTYASTVRAILDNFWLGTGFGTFEDVFPLYRDPSCSGIMGLWDRAHNSYLEFVLGTGLIGLLFLTALLTNLGRVLLSGIRNRRRFRFAPAVGIAILTTVAIHALVDFSIQIQGFAVFCSSVLAASVLFSTNNRVSHHLR